MIKIINFGQHCLLHSEKFTGNTISKLQCVLLFFSVSDTVHLINLLYETTTCG